MSTILEILNSLWNTLCEMAPYLLFGFFMAGALSVLIKQKVVERHLGGKGIAPVIKASLFGIPLPLCSCGVIPVAASLRRQGSSKGATTAFLLSTPQTGIDSIMVTFSLLGPVYAVFRPLAALITGVFGGMTVNFFAGADTDMARSSTHSDEVDFPYRSRSGIAQALRYGFLVLPADIGKSLLVGLLIAGVISALIPDDFFSGILGAGIVGMLVMMAFGIPVYVCAVASVPVAAAMIAKGVSPGAALVFLMTGPATNAATIATIWKTMGRKTAVIYLVVTVITALSAGFLLNYIFKFEKFAVDQIEMAMLPASLKTAAAIALLTILAVSFYQTHRKAKNKALDRGCCGK